MKNMSQSMNSLDTLPHSSIVLSGMKMIFIDDMKNQLYT